MKIKVKRIELQSFKTLLMLSVLAVLILTLAIVSGFMYITSSKILENEIEKEAGITLHLNTVGIVEWRDRVMSELSGLAGLPAFVNNESLEEKAAVFQGFLARNSDFLRFSIVGLDGNGQVVSKDGLGNTVEIPTRPYFQEAAKGATVISEPIVSQADGSIIMNVATPYYDASGNILGVVTGAISSDQIASIVSDITFAKTGYAYLVNDNGDILAHPDSSKVLKENMLDTAADDAQRSEIQAMLDLTEPYTGYFETNGDTFFSGVEKITGTSWNLVITAPRAELVEPINSMLKQTLLIGLLILAAGVILAWWFGGKLSGGIIKIGAAMNKLAQGDLNQKLDIRSKNEIGRLAQDFNAMTDNFRSLISQVAQSSEQVAATSEQLTASSVQTSEASKQISGAIQKVADGSNAQATATAESAKAMEEMATGIQRVAESSGIMSEAASNAAEEAEQGNVTIKNLSAQMESIIHSVKQCGDAINRLDSHSKEIGEIIRVISDIAAQTNLLALNAAIEAARAGDQGRGFAVVAQEVRKLAEQSTGSAQKISDLVNEIQKDTIEAVDAMKINTKEAEAGIIVVNDAGEAFQRIYNATRDVVQQVEEVSAASEQMSASTEEVAASFDETAKFSMESASLAQTVSASSQEQISSMEEISHAADELSRMAQELQGLIGQFKVN